MPLLGWLAGKATEKKMRKNFSDKLAKQYGMDNTCGEPGCNKRVVSGFGENLITKKRISTLEGLYCKKHLKQHRS